MNVPSPKVEAEQLPLGLLSITVFGPGHGEAILLRFPDGSVGIVDGCMESPNPVLELAKKLEVPGRHRLRFAAMSHPHEDHILGLAAVIQELTPEEVWFSGVHHPRAFEPIWTALNKQAALRDVDPEKPAKQKVLREMIDTLVAAPCRKVELIERQTLVRESMEGHHLRVRCLLPTTESNLRAMAMIGGEPVSLERDYQEEGATTFEDIEPHDREVNEVSAVLLVQWGNARILLGGDAELGGKNRGWRTVKDVGKVQVVKVAHHASGGAHHPLLWSELLPDRALVTPYAHASGKQPPQERGLRQLLHDRGRVLVSHPVKWRSGSVVTKTAFISGAKKCESPAKTNPHSAITLQLNAQGEIVGEFLHGDAWEFTG